MPTWSSVCKQDYYFQASLLELPWPLSNYSPPAINFNFYGGYRFSDLPGAFGKNLLYLYSDFCDWAAWTAQFQGCQENCSPIPSSGCCLPSHPHCYVNKEQSTKNLLRPLISWLTGTSDPANLQLLMISAFPISPCS